MTTDPEGTVRYDGDNVVDPSRPGGTPQNPKATVRGEHAMPESTQTGFDETVVQGSQFQDLTEQLAPKSMLGQFGRYMIQGKLGEGGMGAVYIAKDTQLDRDIALKIPKFSPDDKVSVEWFFREARSMATVHHPNLCPVFDVGVIDNIYYMSMAYIEGRPLTDYVKSNKSIQPRQVAAVVRKIALALEEAHQAGIVHRDLKPDNIMINTRKEPVIMDFGLARRENPNEAQLTKTGQVMGTPSYMAPEQVEGNNELIGPRTDVYALGVIMYQMLCGQLPFKGVVTLVLAKIITETPPAPSEIKVDVDPELERICLKAKERDPDRRYQSAAELANDLKKYLSSSASGDTMRRAGTTVNATEEVTRTDQLANEYFDAKPVSYTESAAGCSSDDEYEEYDDEEYVPRHSRLKSSGSRGKSKKKKSGKGQKSGQAGANPLMLKVGGGAAACVVVTMLLLMFPGGDDAPSGQDDSTVATQPGRAENGIGKRKASTPESAGSQLVPGSDTNLAMRLNGRDSFVELPINYDGSHPITIEAFVRLTGDSSRSGHIISNAETGGVALAYDAGQWMFGVRQSKGNVVARGPFGSLTGRLVHLAGVFETGSVRIYRNGELLQEVETGEGFVPSRVNLVIGANPGRNGGIPDIYKTGRNSFYQYADCLIDEVRISSVARYTASFKPPRVGQRFQHDRNTVALYHCDGLENGQLLDSSSNGHHGQVLNCQLVKHKSR